MVINVSNVNVGESAQMECGAQFQMAEKNANKGLLTLTFTREELTSVLAGFLTRYLMTYESSTEGVVNAELIEHHYHEKSKQDLAVLGGRIRDRVNHEVTEVLLSLDRPEPNIPMALTRVTRIRQIVEEK